MTKKEAKEIMCKVTFYWELGEQTLTQNQINEAIDLAIKALEQTRWIPVSERLPESLMVKTLVSCEDANGLPINTMVAIYDAFSKTWDCEYKVIAWQPLPEPYKAESEDKTN